MADKQIDEKQLRKAYMDAFSTSSGDLVLKDLQNRCFKYSSTAVRTWPSVNEVMINEGKRQTLLHIENMMSPEDIEKLDESPEGGE